MYTKIRQLPMLLQLRILTDNINAYNISLASDPMQRKLSPGTGLILKQIELCFKNKIICRFC